MRTAVTLTVTVSIALLPSAASSTVREPNGVNVPVAAPANEISLQRYFDSQGEAINALTDASTEPGVFLPLCDFQATLVLSQAENSAGFDWYNVPASATAAPTAIYPIGPATFTVGQTISGAVIRGSANYAGGLVGFVLMESGQPVYTSEYKRNVYCSACATPDYWKMALVYRSTAFPNSYYVAFEDGAGADRGSWYGNDGDFNDKVFRISGVTCNGGAVACSTGMPGVCANGVTECQAGGSVVCKPLIKPSKELCDNLDNDCNGQVDDGSNLCPAGEVCSKGVCVHPCDDGEFKCLVGLRCDTDGLCKDPRCIGVDCPSGQVCAGGTCVGGCQGVICPAGQDCQLGVCTDPCAGVSCASSVCEKGACVPSCQCRGGCAATQACAADGHCVDSGCESMTCAAGSVCRRGVCVDACDGAICPRGGACRDGACTPPSIDPTGSGGASGAGRGGAGGFLLPPPARGGAGGTAASIGASGAGGSTGGVAAGGGSGGMAGARARGRGGTIGCGCTTGGAPGGIGITLVMLLVVLAGRRRRSRRPPSAFERSGVALQVVAAIAFAFQVAGCAASERGGDNAGTAGVGGIGGAGSGGVSAGGGSGVTGAAGGLVTGTAGTGAGERGGNTGASGVGAGAGGRGGGTAGSGAGGGAGASGASGAGGGASSACDPFSNAGCTAGTKCTVLQTPVTFSLGCGSKAGKTAGATCTQTASGQMQTGDDCADGLACIALQGETTPTCRQFCMTSGATRACPASMTCSLLITNLPGTSFCRPTTSCTLLPQTGCPTGQGCYLVSTGSTCAPAGRATPGSGCTAANDCAPGSTCITTNGVSSCASFCSLAAGGPPACAASGTGGASCMPTPGTPPEPSTGICR